MDESAKRALHGRNRDNFIKLPGLDIGPGPYKPAYDFQGIDKKFKGYDGLHLPFENESFWTVHSSHCLEHIDDYKTAIQEWFRVLKTRGHLLIYVPHQFLYEKKDVLPSRFNPDHKRFYTPASMAAEIEESLEPNTYRVIGIGDNDLGFDYNIKPADHSVGCYEIECIVQKIEPPLWKI